MHPDALSPLLADRGAVVIDGGLATQLEAQGQDLSDRLWSARLLETAPDAIVEAHLAYFRAGARVATTASYQATFEGFARRGIDHDHAVELMRRSVSLAAQARDLFRAELAARGAPDPGLLLVAASIGPYGAMLADGSEYRGRYGLAIGELMAFHRERLRVLAATAADLLAIETIPELDEAVAITRLLDEVPGTPAWISFSCADGSHLRSGELFEAAVAAVAGSPAVVAVGVNCTAPEHVTSLVRLARGVTAKPIVAYPNSGEGWNAAGRRWSGPSSSRVDGAAANRWREAGAALIGGCCRVTPDQIAIVAESLAPLSPGASATRGRALSQT